MRVDTDNKPKPPGMKYLLIYNLYFIYVRTGMKVIAPVIPSIRALLSLNLQYIALWPNNGEWYALSLY